MDFKSLEKDKRIEGVIQFGSSIKKKSFRDIDICIFPAKKLNFKDKLEIVRTFPEKYDVSFYDDLPLDIKKSVLSEGKIIFTKNYFKLLKMLQYVDLEYPRYKSFLKDYHERRVAAI